MAATWQVRIEVTNIAARRVTAIGIRTDGEDVSHYRLATLFDSDNETLSEFQTRIGTHLWQQHQAALAKRSAADALIEESEAIIKAGLDAQEVA